jgi:hypothetical protein
MAVTDAYRASVLWGFDDERTSGGGMYTDGELRGRWKGRGGRVGWGGESRIVSEERDLSERESGEEHG